MLIKTCVIRMSKGSGIESFLTHCIFHMHKKLDYLTEFYTAHLNEPEGSFTRRRKQGVFALG